MRRALQTALIIFREHPNFTNMHFKVHPLLREKMRIAGDMPTLRVLDMIENEFQPSFRGKLEMDLMEQVAKDNDDCWYLPSLNGDLRRDIGELYEEQPAEGKDIEQAVIDVLMDRFPGEQETVENARDRSLAVRAQVFDYLESRVNGERYGTGLHDGKLALVGHSMAFKLMTTHDVYWQEIFHDQLSEHYQKMPPPAYSTLLMNCEIRPLEKQY